MYYFYFIECVGGSSVDLSDKALSDKSEVDLYVSREM